MVRRQRWGGEEEEKVEEELEVKEELEDKVEVEESPSTALSA